MSIRGPLWRLVVASACSMFIALGVAAFAIWNALHTQRLAPANLPSAQPNTPFAPRVVTASSAMVDSAVAHDPFNPDREPARRNAMLAAQTREPVLQNGAAQTAEVRLLGTALLGGSASFATCQLGVEPARALRVGESIAGLTLTRIDQGRVVFRSARGDSMELHIFRPGS